ncbi:hypothetical protein EC950943_4110B, partial [Escherichia coli 95.0943]
SETTILIFPIYSS